MTDYSNFKTTIAEWANRQDWSDTLVSSFVSMAEAKLNAELRIKEMIQNDGGTIFSRCASLPPDWLQMDLIQIANPNGADGYLPIRYKPRDQFFNTTDCWAYGYYTIEADTIYFGGAPDVVNGIGFTLAYYGQVPVFSDTQPSWVYTKFPSLYLFSALMHADLHAIGEEQTALNFKGLAEDIVTKLNAQHLRGKTSGSRLTRTRRRSFG